MERRTFTLAVGATATAAFAGCSSVRLGPGRETDTEDTGTESSPTRTDVVREDSLYVENFDDTSYRLGLTVTSDGADGIVLDDRYELPGEWGMEVPAIGREGHTHTVTVVVEGGPEGTYEWTVGDCEFENVDDRALGAQIRDGNLHFSQNHCDSASVGHELDYHRHTRYAIDE